MFPGPKKEPPGTKRDFPKEVILHPKSDFLNVFFFDVFLSALFSRFFEISGAQRLYFGRHFDSFLGGLGLCKM